MKILLGNWVRVTLLLLISSCSKAPKVTIIDNFDTAGKQEDSSEAEAVQPAKQSNENLSGYIAPWKSSLDLSLSFVELKDKKKEYLSFIEELNTASLRSYLVNGQAKNLVLDPDCSLLKFKADVLHKDPSVVARAFFARCGEKYRKKLTLRDLSNIKNNLAYDFWDNPKVKVIDFKTPDSYITRSMLGLQTSSKGEVLNRPLLLVKLGAQASLTHYSAALMGVLFDASPFHVLMLENSTSTRAIAKNRSLTIGGLVEGLQNYQISKFVMSEKFPYSNHFQGIHLMGLSLGGQSALYSNLYENYDRSPQKSKSRFYSSVQTACPVLDLKDALSRLFNESLLGGVFYQEFREEIIDANSKDEDLIKDIFRRGFPEERIYLPDSFAMASVDYYKEWSKKNKFPTPFEGLMPDNIASYWDANQYYNYATKIKDPVFIWSAGDDPVINIKNGPMGLLDVNRQLGQEMYKTLHIQDGYHCVFSAVYSPVVEASVWHGLVLKAQEQKTQKSIFSIKKMDLKIELCNQCSGQTEIFASWNVDKTKSEKPLSLKVYISKDEKEASDSEKILLHESFYSAQDLDLDFDLLSLSEREELSLQRYLYGNYNLELTNKLSTLQLSWPVFRF